MVAFNHLRINSVQNNSGIFNGQNIQYNWCSVRDSETSFGSISGEMNLLQFPVSAKVEPESREGFLNPIKIEMESRA